MCGNPFLDFDSLQKNARYEGGYSAGERCSDKGSGRSRGSVGRAACCARAACPQASVPPTNVCHWAGMQAMLPGMVQWGAHPRHAVAGTPPSPPAEHRVVQWLWQVVGELTQEERKLFLKFFTGSDRAPIGGLGNLRCLIQVRGEAAGGFAKGRAG